MRCAHLNIETNALCICADRKAFSSAERDSVSPTICAHFRIRLFFKCTIIHFHTLFPGCFLSMLHHRHRRCRTKYVSRFIVKSFSL